MKEINLVNGGVTLVDDEDFKYLNQWKWYAYKSANTFYVKRTDYSTGGQKNIKMHREILCLTDPKILADHIDHNGLNNQRSNLRVATRSQNNSNVLKRDNCSSKYLGVNWNKKDQRWRAKIKKGKYVKHLGNYKNEIDAALAYNNAARKVHGEFANLNNVMIG